MSEKKNEEKFDQTVDNVTIKPDSESEFLPDEKPVSERIDEFFGKSENEDK